MSDDEAKSRMGARTYFDMAESSARVSRNQVVARIVNLGIGGAFAVLGIRGLPIGLATSVPYAILVVTVLCVAACLLYVVLKVMRTPRIRLSIDDSGVTFHFRSGGQKRFPWSGRRSKLLIRDLRGSSVHYQRVAEIVVTTGFSMWPLAAKALVAIVLEAGKRGIAVSHGQTSVMSWARGSPTYRIAFGLS